MRVVSCALAFVLAACDPSPPVDEAPSRPDASVLRFDAAMLDDGPDATMPPPLPPDGGRDAGRDAGVTIGRDSGTPSERFVCRGVARSCSLMSTFSCTNQLGCRLGGDCGGVSWGCYSFYSRYACAEQDGCYWSTSFDDCSGYARSCSAYYSETSCERQEGCRWDDECEGVAWLCSDFLTLSSCLGHAGCRWEAE
jgi:hypothetical protein